MTKYINIFISFILILNGVKIIYTKNISQGNASMKIDDVYLGNYAFILGAILLGFGLYILYYVVYIQESKNKKD